MIDYKLWKQNIYSSIEDISDLERQKIIWTGKDPRFASSFGEDISMLYDTFCFADDFWDEKHLAEFKFNSELLSLLRAFKGMIDSYKRDLLDVEILNDPEWHKIVNQAKIIIENWDIRTK